MYYVLPVLIVIFYFLVRQVIYNNRKIKFLASIEKIKLSIIRPNLITPEVEIFFKYLYGGGIYTGRGFIPLSEFKIYQDFKIYYNTNEVPILEYEEKSFPNEEHIEAFLLSISNSVYINIDPIEPYRFEILNLHSELQNPQNKI